MRESSDVVFDALIEGVLGIARRETLVLAAALQQNNRAAAADASSKVRYAIAYATQCASRSHADFKRLGERIALIQRSVEGWLPQGIASEVERDLHSKILAKGRLAQIHADDVLVVALNLDDLPLTGLSVCRSKLVRISARQAALDMILAEAAIISESTFQAANLRLGNFSSVTFEKCDFSKANLDGSKWRRAVVKNCDFREAVLFHADLSGSHFIECDFRDADLQAFPDTPTAGAMFIHCDFRRSGWHQRNLGDVSFVDCKLYGTFGQVTGLESAVFDRACLSPDGDGKQVVQKQEVIERWRRSP
jgi:uncharacterized protein YjbI with pentapeptide repeats